MPTILLEQIIELLTGWKDSFFTWANAIGDKIASIKTNTDSLPDIKDNTDDIKDNTAAVITPISNINTNVASITSDTAFIRTDTGIIKNNAQAIATSSGQAAAYAQDVANNTLEVKNKVTTIASDTTQMRADSGSIRADVSEIKETLGLYLYNTIVTEDSEGAIANFDTDLQDYLQNAKVTIPADANGISGFNLNRFNSNFLSGLELGALDGNGAEVVNNDCVRSGFIPIKNGERYSFGGSNYGTAKVYRLDSSVFFGYDANKQFVAKEQAIFTYNQNTYTSSPFSLTFNNPNVKYVRCYFRKTSNPIDVDTVRSNCIFCYGSSLTPYELSDNNISAVTFGSSITDGAEVDLLSGVVKINTSPITYDSITPLAIRTFKGVNNIYSDIGDISVTYRETLKHYLEKQEAASRSLNRNVNLLRENISSTEDIVDDSDRRI